VHYLFAFTVPAGAIFQYDVEQSRKYVSYAFIQWESEKEDLLHV